MGTNYNNALYCSIKYVTSLLQAVCGIVLNKADPLQASCRHNIKYAVKGTCLAQAKFILQACKCFSRYTAGLQSPSLPGLRQACILKQVCYRHYIQLNRMLTGLSQYKIFVRVQLLYTVQYLTVLFHTLFHKWEWPDSINTKYVSEGITRMYSAVKFINIH